MEDEIEEKLKAMIVGLLSGTASVRIKRQELADPPAVVWDISLVQLTPKED